jgi:hypothetical protein
MGKNSMIPSAYLFTEKVHARYINTYASSFYEIFTLDEALEVNPQKLQNLYNTAYVVSKMRLVKKNTKIFVIYHPNKQHLTLSQIADSDTIKVLVDSLAKQRLLAAYKSNLDNLRLTLQQFALFDNQRTIVKSLKTFASVEVKQAKKIILQDSSNIKENFLLIGESLTSSFKKDFCF